MGAPMDEENKRQAGGQTLNWMQNIKGELQDQMQSEILMPGII
jgi:hypothetical protein